MASNSSSYDEIMSRIPLPPKIIERATPPARGIQRAKLPSFARPITLATNDETSLLSWCVKITYNVIEHFIEAAQLNHSIARAIGWNEAMNKAPAQHPDGKFRISDEIYGELITWYARHIRDGHDLYPGLTALFDVILAKTDTQMFDLLLKNFPTHAILPDSSAPNYDAVSRAFRKQAQDIVGGGSRSGRSFSGAY